MYIVNDVSNLKNKKFAVIIDEAHSSTAGKDMVAVTKTLGSSDLDIDDALIEGLEQNQDFFSLLLSNKDIKEKVLGIFTEEIYNSLKKHNSIEI